MNSSPPRSTEDLLKIQNSQNPLQQDEGEQIWTLNF